MVTQATFDLGQIVATPGALDLLAEHNVEPLTLIEQHARGDWGTIDPEDRGLNEQAIQDGSRIFSVYRVGDQKVWLITNGADDAGHRDATTLLLPSEY